MMKKIIVITLILILTLSIIGCGKSSAIPSLDEIKSDRYTEEDYSICGSVLVGTGKKVYLAAVYSYGIVK